MWLKQTLGYTALEAGGSLHGLIHTVRIWGEPYDLLHSNWRAPQRGRRRQCKWSWSWLWTHSRFNFVDAEEEECCAIRFLNMNGLGGLALCHSSWSIDASWINAGLPAPKSLWNASVKKVSYPLIEIGTRFTAATSIQFSRRATQQRAPLSHSKNAVLLQYFLFGYSFESIVPTMQRSTAKAHYDTAATLSDCFINLIFIELNDGDMMIWYEKSSECCPQKE